VWIVIGSRAVASMGIRSHLELINSIRAVQFARRSAHAFRFDVLDTVRVSSQQVFLLDGHRERQRGDGRFVPTALG
jgi:urease beta subunit